MSEHSFPAPQPTMSLPWYDADELRWTARHWAVRIGVKVPQIHLRGMTSKWASISTAGRLTLNTDLLSVPRELGEFVIVHELVHLLVPNHGKLFKSFMYAYVPDWEEREERLRMYGSLPTRYNESLNTGCLRSSKIARHRLLRLRKHR